MARRSPRRHRRLLAGVGLAVTASAVGAGLLMSTELAGAGASLPQNERGETGVGASDGIVIVCESGVVSQDGGVETSSAIAVRAPDGTEVPPGCRGG